ncbi:MAG: hypothetical protein FWE44_04045 [Defluviitaleaceae bacterium]|nr:hypothetical protein [Defluviitaleaceae bacterium]
MKPTTAWYDGSFAQKLHGFATSPMFLIGTILYTTYAVINVFEIFPFFFNFFSMISITIQFLPVVALWMLHSSAKGQDPDKTLVAIKLFKISVIIGLVLISLGSALVLFGTLLALSVSPSSLLLLIVFAMLASVIVFYFVPLLFILNSIRDGVRYNFTKPLRGVNPFVVYMLINFVLSAILVSFPNLMTNWLIRMGVEYTDITVTMPTVGSGMFSTIFANVSMALFVFVIYIFNRSLKEASPQ